MRTRTGAVDDEARETENRRTEWFREGVGGRPPPGGAGREGEAGRAAKMAAPTGASKMAAARGSAPPASRVSAPARPPGPKMAAQRLAFSTWSLGADLVSKWLPGPRRLGLPSHRPGPGSRRPAPVTATEAAARGPGRQPGAPSRNGGSRGDGRCSAAPSAAREALPFRAEVTPRRRPLPSPRGTSYGEA